MGKIEWCNVCSYVRNWLILTIPLNQQFVCIYFHVASVQVCVKVSLFLIRTNLLTLAKDWHECK